MSAQKKKSAAKSTRSTASTAARKAATSATKSAAKGAAKSAAKGAGKASTRAVAASSDRIGRGTRWTEQQVKLLLDTVDSSGTAKEAFELVARELGKSAGTVAQKYYNLQKAATSGATKKQGPGRPAGSRSRTTGSKGAARTSAGLPTAPQLRDVTIDELVGLAARVKAEVDRRREELDAATKALAG
ncbi:MAG: hypothetical protein KDC46_02895 [Thermoleophilia bacterium]|nr:hypothetical protein [Thermoleophilia bacterium]